MTTGSLPKNKLLRMALVRYFAALVFLAVLFFLPAGTLDYWQAWVYLAVIFIPMGFVMTYMLRNAPDLLERRFRMREKESTEKKIIPISWIFFLVAFLLPGLDRRFGWSQMPAWVVLAADGLVLLGYYIVFLVFRENSYASRVVEVEQEQKVISSGVYAIVRHPMYVGILLFYGASTIALGSWWAFLPVLPIIGIIIARILDEERLLARDLPGYSEYMQKVRFRLLPGIW